MIVRFVCFWCASFALASLVSAQQATRPASSKKLIEFGWDEPDTAYMRLHIAEMEKTPFDGTVFHVNYAGDEGKPQTFMSAGWGKRAFTMAELQPAIDDLKATPFKSFTHNFHRFNVTPGDVDWFDDAGFAAVVRNARLAGRGAEEGKARGGLVEKFHIDRGKVAVGQYFSYFFPLQRAGADNRNAVQVAAAQILVRGGSGFGGCAHEGKDAF